MYLANIRGLWKFARLKPKLFSVSALNLRHRLTHNLDFGRVNGQSHPPEMLSIFVTDRCNMRCRECHYAHSDKPGYQLNRVGDMDADVFYKMIDETPGNPIVSFTGGEPLLHPQISEFIAYAKEAGRFCGLVTNGWMLAKHAHAICEAGLDLLTVSLEGSKSTHDHIRGKNSYRRLMEGIRTVLTYQKRPLVVVSIAISDMNYEELLPTYELVKDLGVDGLNINHLWMQTEGSVSQFNSSFNLFQADMVSWEVQLGAIQVDKLANTLEEIRHRNWGSSFLLSESPYLNRAEIAGWYRTPDRPVKYETVRCGWMRFKVWPDGKVKPCRDWVVGDLNQQHVMEIWNGRDYQEFRGLLKAHGLLPICNRCCQIALR